MAENKHEQLESTNENERIWLRLGVSLDVPEEQKTKILNGDNTALLDVLTNPGIKNGEWQINGETYIPQSSAYEEVDFDLPIISMTERIKTSPHEKEQNAILPVIDMEKLESVLRKNGFTNEETQAIWHTVWDYAGDWLDAFDKRFMKEVAASDVTADDKFYLHDNGQIEQLYYNPDGYGGNGQYVSDNYYWQDVLNAAKHANGSVDAFFEYFYEISRQYLFDNNGSDDFKDVEARFDGDKHDFMSCTEKTMYGLIKFAREQEKAVNVEKQPDIKTGDFIEYDNKRWHVDYVSADTIQLTNINPLDNDKEIRASRWKDHIKEYTVVDKSEIDMSTLKPTKQKPSLTDRIEKGKEKVREADKNKDKTVTPKNKKKGVDIDG